MSGMSASVLESAGHVTVSVERGSGFGHWNVTFESAAKPGALAVFTGALALSRLDITSAIVRKTADDRVIDSFDVAPLDGVEFGPESAAALAAIATAALRGQRNLDAELRAMRRHDPVAELSTPVRIETCTESELTTGIVVRAGDRLGLLHDIAATLTKHGLRTRSVTALTYGGRAHDSFRVVDADGQPPKDPARLTALSAELAAVCRG